MHGSVDKTYSAVNKRIQKQLKDEKRSIKEQYSRGEMSREQAATAKKEARQRAIQSRNKNEIDMAVSHYKVQKLLRKYKAENMRTLYGENDKRYKKAIEAVNRSYEFYNNYAINALPDGSYKVRRMEYY